MQLQLLEILDMLKNKTLIAVFINCLAMTNNVGTMLYKRLIYYLLMLN